MTWSWSQIEPYFQDLLDRKLNPDNTAVWLSVWTQISDLVSESYSRLKVAITLDTTNEDAERDFNKFLDDIYLQAQSATRSLKTRCLQGDWRGLEAEAITGRYRKPYIHRYLFFFYGLAQLGSVQGWISSFSDPGTTLKQYRLALSLGGTV